MGVLEKGVHPVGRSRTARYLCETRGQSGSTCKWIVIQLYVLGSWWCTKCMGRLNRTALRQQEAGFHMTRGGAMKVKMRILPPWHGRRLIKTTNQTQPSRGPYSRKSWVPRGNCMSTVRALRHCGDVQVRHHRPREAIRLNLCII